MSRIGSHPILEAREVWRAYQRGRFTVNALRGVSFTIERGSFLAIMGPSGSGKTTLLNTLAGLDRPTRGEILVDGQSLAALDAKSATVFRRRTIGFVFQFFNLLPTMTARDNVALPLLAERLPGDVIDQRVESMLSAVGLLDRAEHRPIELSGGEQQRVAIARALVMRPPLVLADEPTGNLDSSTGDSILALLRRVVEETATAVLIVTHSTAAARAVDRTLTLQDGLLRDTG